MKARVVLLHNTEAEWSKLSFKPEKGELVVYDPDDTFDYPRFKIGDGEQYLSDLPFCVDRAVETVLDARKHHEFIDAGRITDYIV